MLRNKVLVIFIFIIFSCGKQESLPQIQNYSDIALQFNKVLSLPTLNVTTNELISETNYAIHYTDSILDKLISIDDNQINFESVIVAIENIYYPTSMLSNKLELIANTSPNEHLRAISERLSEELSEWSIKSSYREDIYEVIKKLEKLNPVLNGEDEKLFNDYLIGYKRSGFDLPSEVRENIISLSLELSQLSAEFYTNIREFDASICFSQAELSDIPKDLLSQLSVDSSGNYIIDPTIYFQTNLILKNSSDEQIRKKVCIASNSVAKNTNIALLDSIIRKRSHLAHLLNYSSWADYSIEPKMAKTPKVVRSLLEDLSSKLGPKFTKDIEVLRQMKISETGDGSTQMNYWDVNYYENKRINQTFNFNPELLREYFSYDRVLSGMFSIFEEIFGITITKIQPPFKWVESIELFIITDKENENPLGLFYTDMFPRKGKYNHFAQFDLISGRKLSDGKFQCPVAALVCNFPPPSQDTTSLLYLEDVITLFHEFGHILHFIFSKADYPSNSGTNVPDDFVEAPSQLLENWVYQKQILDRFAKHYTSKTIPLNVISNLSKLQNLTVSTSYRSQISYALIDIILHSITFSNGFQDIYEIANNIISKYYLPLPTGCAFIASFDHLIDYDAGYYGYIWSEVISDDMASIFQNSPNGFLDRKTGIKLRKEIYEVGDSRDINKSIENFLGRKWNSKSFTKELNLSD